MDNLPNSNMIYLSDFNPSLLNYMTWINLKSALVSGVIVGILGVAGYILNIGDIFKLDLHTLANVGAISALTAIVSLLKSVATTTNGKIAGIQIK